MSAEGLYGISLVGLECLTMYVRARRSLSRKREWTAAVLRCINPSDATATCTVFAGTDLRVCQSVRLMELKVVQP